MKFVIRFQDNPEYVSKREEFMPQHLAFLVQHQANIIMAGPVFDASSDEGAGGQWIVETENLAEAARLVKTDPLYATGLRDTIQIFEWKTVFENGCVIPLA